MTAGLSRREWIVGASALAGAAAVPLSAGEKPAKQGKFRYCFNTSTIRGQKLPLDQQISVTAKAGYSGIEPWIRDIDGWKKSGKSLKDIRKQLSDLGITVESAIGFSRWIVDDDAERKKGLEQAKREMGMLAEIGGKRIAAPPSGATRGKQLDLFAAAERYAKLLELGAKEGVLPQLEVWGFSRNLSRLGESVFVAVESGRADACLLPDVYHIYKGGSDFAGLSLLAGSAIHVFHINDYPATPDRKAIGDRDRVFPGDGIAPLKSILTTVSKSGSPPVLSLELFNPQYWKQDALTVARTGLAKMKAAAAGIKSSGNN